ncbi:hypothetical protein N9Z18_00185 [Verrucomicrobiales bacterium]|nr:hypothetical protein [Verrucomicrobiales bacterium]
MNRSFLPLLLLVTLLSAEASRAEMPFHPKDLEFKRQAVRRMIFDADQAIPLGSLRPTTVRDFDLMHPELGGEVPGASLIKWTINEGRLIAESGNAPDESLRWVGGFNAFATYGLSIEKCEGTGSTGMAFQDSSNGDLMIARLHFKEGKPTRLTWEVELDGKGVVQKVWALSNEVSSEGLILRIQMAVVGVNLLIESHGESRLIGFSDFSEHIDLREKRHMRHFDFGVGVDLAADSRVSISGATAALTPGTGQADIRAITDPEGNALIDEGRLWFTMTVRGRALANPMQAVFSLNPSVFDVQFEGIIAFDLGDGMLRNEHASHLFHDPESGEWRGWTTGFSAYGGDGGEEAKTILAVSSTRDPRKGFSIMKAKPVGIDGAHEDPHCIYDVEAKKWRLLLCEKHEKFRAGMWESDHWDRGFKRIAGPVPMDSTGTMIQKFDGKRYALYGSADRKIYIASYPDLKPAGELSVYQPPWKEGTGTRIWPNVIPLPKGYPAPFLALMMDRVNFPGMPKPNWTYGALYLYHGYFPEAE